MLKLTDSQLIVLSKAAAREDRVAVAPRGMNKATAAKVAASAIENHKKGTTICFAGGDKDSAVYVTETIEEILERCGEIQRADKA